MSAPDPVKTPYEKEAQKLPDNLLDAINLFDHSSFYRNALGDSFVDYLTTLKPAEWRRYHQAISEWEQNEYFGLF
jgi:glutamine synthetase